MGLLGGDKAYYLNYRGNGCGGCNLPFDNIEDAVEYATSRHATYLAVFESHGNKLVARGSRKDCRYKFDIEYEFCV